MRPPRGIRPFAVSPAQDPVLDLLIDHAAAHPGTVAVIDLDGTLFDTRPRIVHLLRELASHHGLWDLYRLQPHHLESWDLGDALLLAGLPPGRVQALLPEVEPWFRRRFFSGDCLQHDHAFPGASGAVWACYRAGMQVVYLTGRHEEMREGTERSLHTWGFPFGRAGTHLIVKPQMTTDDTAFKAEAVRELRAWGAPTLFVDNEPANVNRFRELAPEALVVWVDADHSPRADRVPDDVPRLCGWLRTSAPWLRGLDEQGRGPA